MIARFQSNNKWGNGKMRQNDQEPKHFDANQVVFLPKWARILLLFLLGLLGACATLSGVYFLIQPEGGDKVVPLMSVAQTTIGAFAVILFVLFAERQLSTPRLYEKTDNFLQKQMLESLMHIEVPQAAKDETAKVQTLARPKNIHGGRKDIFGCNYTIQIGSQKTKIWVGINVRRLSVIYFAKVKNQDDVERIREAFKFTFKGAEKVGYHTNFEYAKIDNEDIVSIWSTVVAESGILGNPSEQLFWTQDVAMMTQSLMRAAMRAEPPINLHPASLPGPL